MATPSQMAADNNARAGKLNRRVTIQTPIMTPDGQGGSQITGWNNLLTNIPAEVSHFIPRSTGEEKYVAQQLYATDMILVRIRYRVSTNINAGMQLLYRSKKYRIRGVQIPEEGQKSILIQAEEIQTKGSAA